MIMIALAEGATGEDDFISFVSFGTGEVMMEISNPVDY